MIKIIAKLILILTLFQVNNTFAQEDDLSMHKSFFDAQINNYQYWLEKTTLSQYIHLDSSRTELLTVKNEKLTAYFRIPNSSTWDSLEYDFLIQTGDSLKIELFEYFVYLMEVPRNMAFINIVGDDVLIKIYDDNGTVSLFISATKNPIEQSFYIQIDASKFIGSSSINTDSPFQGIKDKILLILKEDLDQSEFKTRHTSFKLFETDEYLLEYQALNLTKRIIPANILGRGYYEKLDFRIVIDPVQDIPSHYQINIRLQGKYGSGLFEPKNARYKPMSPEYNELLREYIKDFENKIKLDIK